ncbi:hypothetical protein MMC07_002909 [Pseudocyphellaria aurata]|nr:hypothetical protein [Pseudocyphellaria aurata]
MEFEKLREAPPYKALLQLATTVEGKLKEGGVADVLTIYLVVVNGKDVNSLWGCRSLLQSGVIYGLDPDKLTDGVNPPYIRENEGSRARIAALQAGSNTVAITRAQADEEEPIGEIPPTALLVASRYPGLPKVEIARSFSNKFRPENLYRLRHLKGREDKYREENVTIENGQMKLKRATGNLRDFGATWDIWSEAFINYIMIMVDFFGGSFPTLCRVLLLFWSKIRKLAKLSKIYEWQWKVQMEGKMRQDARFFDTAQARIDFVMGQVAGKAFGHLEPQQREGSSRPWSDSTENFARLERVYGDPPRQAHAENNFRSLHMGNDFNQFWAEFQRLMPELDRSERTLISDLKSKLPPRCGDSSTPVVEAAAERYSERRTASKLAPATTTATRAAPVRTAATSAASVIRGREEAVDDGRSMRHMQGKRPHDWPVYESVEADELAEAGASSGESGGCQRTGVGKHQTPVIVATGGEKPLLVSASSGDLFTESALVTECRQETRRMEFHQQHSLIQVLLVLDSSTKQWRASCVNG